jgi:hypothetical protein
MNIKIEMYETITLSVVLYGCYFRKKEVECVENISSPSARHGGAWGERRYSSYSFTTSALDGVSG